ncbi:MAG: metalloregulator ArsR/SmtB family transcription factor [Mobilitalea sp.]
MREEYYNYAVILKALSDPNRLCIVENLKEGDLCACKILEQLKITQSTLSHHMKILCDAELVVCKRDGKWMYYSLCGNKFIELKDLMERFAKK